MAALDREQMHEILALALPAGERLHYCAYGVHRPPAAWMALPYALGVVPGLFLSRRLTRHYVVGMSRNYLIIAELARDWRSRSLALDAVKSCDAISLNTLRGVPKQVRIGARSTLIRLGTGRERFEACFRGGFPKGNARDVAAMAEIIGALTDRRKVARA